VGYHVGATVRATVFARDYAEAVAYLHDNADAPADTLAVDPLPPGADAALGDIARALTPDP
jgi:hypothetical protein